MKKTVLNRVKDIIASREPEEMANIESKESNNAQFEMLEVGESGEEILKVNVIYFK